MAFDTLEWPYIWAALAKFGFGPGFIGWVQLLYDNPLAQVVVNGRVSAPFALGRGTRQGCPLSPLLFALCLEPLAEWLRWEPSICGLRWTPEYEDRVSLYADDILLYLTSPYKSLIVLVDVLRSFGRNSGLVINWAKSCVYVLSGVAPPLPRGCPIQVAQSGFKYLGIFITLDPVARYERNLLPPLQRLRADVEGWQRLPLSPLGRAALFKMMSLPRFLYALQNTMDVVPARYFREVESLQRRLFWDGRPRIALAKLTLPWVDGGIALPDIKRYYWASQLAAVNHGTYGPALNPAFEMDKLLLPGGDYNRALYSRPIAPRLTGPTRVAVQVWHAASAAMGWEDRLTRATPLYASQRLGSLWTTKGFEKWDMIGICKVGDLWTKGKFKTFDMLKTEYQLNDREYFRYVQVHHALCSVFPDVAAIPESSPLEDRVLDGYLPDSTISLIYKKLINDRLDLLTALRETWIADGLELDDEDWVSAAASPKEVAIPARLRFVQLKILHRVYVTGPGLMRMGYSVDGLCKRGCGLLGTFLHILWECPEVTQFWRGVHVVLEAVTHVALLPEARRCLLNVWEPNDYNVMQTQWATLGYMVAKRDIAQLWGSQRSPTITAWEEHMDWCMFREKTVYVARGKPGKWIKMWGPWNSYRGNICAPPQTREEDAAWSP